MAVTKLDGLGLSFSGLLARGSFASMARRGLYQSSPPALQTKEDMNATLLMSWWCTCFALVIIIIRVFGRYVRTEKLFREDKIMAASIIPLMTRMALVHVILIWGTNNTVTDGLSLLDVRHRQIGSKLVLASRIFYAAFIWTAKLTILEFLKRIVGTYWRKSYEIGFQIVRYFLLATFIAVIVATLAECQPFDHYWQVIPDPGPQCRAGLPQLLTMGTCDIVTDVFLVVFPIPIVIVSTMTLKRKVSLVLLFALSLALVAITAYRIPSTISRGGAQQYRSLLASLEILAAAGVSNSVVIGSFIRDRGVKKPKYRRESIGGSSTLDRTLTKRTTITQNHWGSDSDLVGNLGMYLSPDLQSRKSSITSAAPRPVPPPSPSPLVEQGESAKRNMANDVSSVSTDSTTDLKQDLSTEEPSVKAVSEPATPKKMSFFDVGNLMQSDEQLSSPPSSRTANDNSQHSSLKGCAKSPALNQPQLQHGPPAADDTASFADVGGLLSSTRASTDLDRSTAPPPAARYHPSSPSLSPPPSSSRNFSRPCSPHNQPSRRDSTTIRAEPPPPSYSSRRESETPRWNYSEAENSMEIVDAGGLLK